MNDTPRSRQTTLVEQLPDHEAFGTRKPFVFFLSGSLVGRKYLLREEATVVGRSSSCTITVNDPHISRQHFEIRLDPRGAVLVDDTSTNGTYVNGVRMKRHRLRDGDRIRISSATIMKFSLQDVTESRFHDHLYKMAVLDEVTGAHNRRYLLQRLEEEFEQARQRESSLSLLMLDLDHFKRVNDTYGHLAGDAVLRAIADAVKETLRTNDVLARYGGEEFAVLLLDADELRAVNVAERIRERVADNPVPVDEHAIAVTLSIGVATFGPATPVDGIEELLRVADSCLYVSKEAGRNRTTPASRLADACRGVV